MAEIPHESSSNLPKTIDALGLQSSVDYAQKEKIISETKRYLAPTGYKLPTEKETIEPTTTLLEEIEGSLQKGRYAIFPERPSFSTRPSAFIHGRCIESIGPGSDLKEKINSIPNNLKDQSKDYERIQSFSNKYQEIDRNCSYISGNCKQYHKG